MKFYLCQTGDGPLYARTQADAKALDKNFETVNHDTDQAALVERFNARFEEGKVFATGAPVSVLVEGPDAEGLVWSEPEPAPKKKTKEPVRDEHGQRQWDAISIEEFMMDLPKKASHMLHGIIFTAQERLKELEG